MESPNSGQNMKDLGTGNAVKGVGGDGKSQTDNSRKENTKLFEISLDYDKEAFENLGGQAAPADKKKTEFTEPPIKVDATLHLAWGLTLNLSAQNNQGTLGQTLRDYFLKEITSTYVGDKINDPKSKRYLDNLIALLSTYLRSIGYEKDVYDNFLDIQKSKKEQKITTINNLADFTSFSSESIIAKIASFVGIGSLVQLITSIRGPSPLQIELQNSLKSLADQAQLHPENAENISKAIAAVSSAANAIQASSTWSPEIAILLAGGFAGVVGVTLVVRYYRDRLTMRYIEETNAVQQRYWESVMRPSYFRSLLHLFEDVKDLVCKEYPQYKEKILEDDKEVNRTIETVLPRVFLYRTDLRQKIMGLPPNRKKEKD